MKLATLLLTLMFAVPVFAQNTKTDCDINGQSVGCTTKPDNSWQAEWDKREAQRKARLAADRNSRVAAQAVADATAAKERGDRENAMRINDAYCQTNPNGSVALEGVTRTCTDWTAYEKAFCTVNVGASYCKIQSQGEAERLTCVLSGNVCKAPESEAEVQRAFAELNTHFQQDHPKRGSTQAYYESLYNKARQWGCGAFPEMTTPVWGKPDQPCNLSVH